MAAGMFSGSGVSSASICTLWGQIADAAVGVLSLLRLDSVGVQHGGHVPMKTCVSLAASLRCAGMKREKGLWRGSVAGSCMPPCSSRPGSPRTAMVVRSAPSPPRKCTSSESTSPRYRLVCRAGDAQTKSRLDGWIRTRGRHFKVRYLLVSYSVANTGNSL